MKVRFATIGGLRTRYLTAGEGPALILIQPVGYPADVYARTIVGLSKTHHVIAPDVPGQGFSEAPESWSHPPQSIMAESVLALADHLRVDRFSIVGSSLGGLVAALVALDAPSRVSNLVLVGTGSVFNPPAGQPKVFEAVYANGSRAFEDPSFQTCRDRMSKLCYRMPTADDILLAQLTAYAIPGALESYRAIIDGVSRSIATPAAAAYHRLEKIRSRTLVVIGMQDVRTSYTAHEAGASRIADAQIVSIPECGHLPFLEAPEAFNDALSRFLEGEEVGARPLRDAEAPQA